MGVDGWLHEGVAVLEPHSATEGVEGRVTAGVTHNEPQDVPELKDR